MSKDPNTNAPPKGGTQDSLEDLVYRSSLSAGNKGVQKASPLVTIPVTIISYLLFGVAAVELVKHNEAAQKVIKKTVGIDLQEENAKKEDEPPPPPPPPPAPAAPVAPPRAVTREDAPPPPPINPNQDIVPELAPKELPKQDLSLAYAQPAGAAGAGVPGAGVTGASVSTGMAVAGSSTGHVVDFDFSQVKVKLQPPAPPYPPLAKIARIQGTVIVEIIVGTDGVPVSAKAIEGPQQLRPTAEAYAMQWRFEPCMSGGVPQQARFKLTMPFKLR